MRAVRFYRSALSRQVGEAVRIRRRGGAGNILNSKTEYDRCKIPRLVVQEEDEEQLRKEEEQEITEINKELDREQNEWGSRKSDERSGESKEIVRNFGGIQERSNPKKREGAEAGNRRKKKLKYAPLGEEWGYTNMEEQQTQLPLELAPKSTTDWEQPESHLRSREQQGEGEEANPIRLLSKSRRSLQADLPMYLRVYLPPQLPQLWTTQRRRRRSR